MWIEDTMYILNIKEEINNVKEKMIFCCCKETNFNCFLFLVLQPMRNVLITKWITQEQSVWVIDHLMKIYCMFSQHKLILMMHVEY